MRRDRPFIINFPFHFSNKNWKKILENQVSWGAHPVGECSCQVYLAKARASSATTGNLIRFFWKIFFYPTVYLVFSIFPPFFSQLHAQEKKGSVSWKPQIYIYQPPAPEISTSPVFRSADPQIIQKLIDLLEETSLGKVESDSETPSLIEVKNFLTPQGLELKNRLTNIRVALSESLGWEGIKHIRVISEQNLKQRLTTVARWDHTPYVRAIALIALATLRDKNDLVYFRESLWSRNIGIRFATIESLKIWSYPDAILLLQEITEKDDSKLIRVAAAKALSWLNDPRGLELLREYLGDRDWFVRAFAAKSLGEVGNHEDYDLLLSQLSREQIINTNEFIIAEISIAALKLYPQKIEKEKEKEEERRRKKKKIPASLPSPAKKETAPKKGILFELEPLLVTAPRLKISPNELVDPQINFQLLKMIQQKEDLRLSQELADESAAYRDLDQLVTPNGIRLKARYTVLGYLLTEGLAGTKDFQLVNELTRIAHERKNPDVSSYALIALAYSKDQNSLGLFQEALNKIDSVADRFAAIEALQISEFNEAIPILTAVTKLDPSRILRVYAAQAILRLGDEIGRDFLLGSLNDPDWVVRAMAMRYLGELGRGEDYPRLLSYFGLQEKSIVQAEMCSALLRLYAKKFEEENQEQEEGNQEQ